MATDSASRARGFAGLSDLLTDVEPLIARAERLRPAERPSTPGLNSTGRETAPSARVAGGVPPRQATEPLEKSHARGHRKARLAVIGGFVALVGYMALQDPPSSPGADSSSVPSASANAVLANPFDEQATSQSGAPSYRESLEEERPPVGGGGRILSIAQMQYCLAEDIRLTSSKGTVNEYSSSDIDRFNEFVQDYNDRCGEYKYRERERRIAERTVESFRSDLEQQGRSRF